MRLCQMYNGLISYICSMYEKNPEEETFKTFFLKYHDVLVLYAASILKNVDAAEDVVLGCFVQAWESSLYKKLSDGLDKYMYDNKTIIIGFCSVIIGRDGNGSGLFCTCLRKE